MGVTFEIKALARKICKSTQTAVAKLGDLLLSILFYFRKSHFPFVFDVQYIFYPLVNIFLNM